MNFDEYGEISEVGGRGRRNFYSRAPLVTRARKALMWWLVGDGKTLLAHRKRTSNTPQTHLKRTSNATQTQFKRTSNALQTHTSKKIKNQQICKKSSSKADIPRFGFLVTNSVIKNQNVSLGDGHMVKFGKFHQ